MRRRRRKGVLQYAPTPSGEQLFQPFLVADQNLFWLDVYQLGAFELPKVAGYSFSGGTKSLGNFLTREWNGQEIAASRVTAALCEHIEKEFDESFLDILKGNLFD